MTEDSALGQLVGAYLNQDLFDFYPDVMAAVDDFVADAPDLAVILPSDIDRVLAGHPRDDELNAVLARYGVGFLPDERGYREWLTQIADRVRAATS